MPPALSMHGIAKRFGATTALADVSLEVAAGEVLALDRRERGRQEHADEDSQRGARRPTRAECSSPAEPLRARRAACSPIGRRGDDLSGAEPGARLERRRQHHARPGAAPLGAARASRATSRSAPGTGTARPPRSAARCAGAPAVGWHAAARRDRPGARLQSQGRSSSTSPPARSPQHDVDNLFRVIKRAASTPASPSSTSAIFWKRSAGWPIATPCCATAAWSAAAHWPVPPSSRS